MTIADQILAKLKLSGVARPDVHYRNALRRSARQGAPTKPRCPACGQVVESVAALSVGRSDP